MAVTISGSGTIDVGGTSTSQGTVRLYEDTDNGTNYVELVAPASVASNVTLTMPTTTGTVATVAGSDTQVIFNDGGSTFGGDAGLTYNKTTDTLTTSVVAHGAGTASAPSVTTTGDTNTGVFFPAADTAAITTGGTERMRIDSSGIVGVGITPSAWDTSASTKALQVGVGSLWTYAGAQTDLSFNSFYDGTNYKRINADFTSRYAQTVGTHRWFYAASGSAGSTFSWSEAMRITSAGNLLVGTTTNNASGGVIQVSNGITFPASQSASSDANTLDDYEEGTWTPTCSNGSTYSGTYTKIGRIVHLFFETSSSGTITANSTTLSGLPFTPSGSANSSGSGTYVNITSTTAFGGLQITTSSLYFVTSTSSAALRGYHCYYV